MQIIVLDENYDALGTVSVFNTLIWDRRYYEPGVFELHAPVTYFSMFRDGKYVYRNDRTELGVIEDFSYVQDDNGRRYCFAKGRFFESRMNERVIYPMFNMSGKPGAICRSLMQKYITSPSVSNRKISNIDLATASTTGTSMEIQNLGDFLGDKMYEILKTQEMSFRFAFNYQTNRLTFETWQGKDRRDSQSTNSWAVFSNSFYNIKNINYEMVDSTYKNYAYVAGEGEGTDRTVVEVDIRSSTSEKRRELFVDARDLQSKYSDEDGIEHSYTTTEYKAMLQQRGLEKLSEYLTLETARSDIDPNSNLIYLEDFDLGDLCTYQNLDVGIQCDRRITNIQEIYEGSKFTLNVTFGEDEASTITKIIRRETS